MTSKTIRAFSYSFRGLISSPFYLILILDFEYCSGCDLGFIKISRLGIRERNFNIRNVLPEKHGPTKSVRLLLLTFSIFGCSFWIEVLSLFFLLPAF